MHAYVVSGRDSGAPITQRPQLLGLRIAAMRLMLCLCPLDGSLADDAEAAFVFVQDPQGLAVMAG